MASSPSHNDGHLTDGGTSSLCHTTRLVPSFRINTTVHGFIRNGPEWAQEGNLVVTYRSALSVSTAIQTQVEMYIFVAKECTFDKQSLCFTNVSGS